MRTEVVRVAGERSRHYSIGEALKGSKLDEFWKYAAVRRVGDYHVIAHIKDDVQRVLVVRVGSRDKVYR